MSYTDMLSAETRKNGFEQWNKEHPLGNAVGETTTESAIEKISNSLKETLEKEIHSPIAGSDKVLDSIFEYSSFKEFESVYNLIIEDETFKKFSKETDHNHFRYALDRYRRFLQDLQHEENYNKFYKLLKFFVGQADENAKKRDGVRHPTISTVSDFREKYSLPKGFNTFPIPGVSHDLEFGVRFFNNGSHSSYKTTYLNTGWLAIRPSFSPVHGWPRLIEKLYVTESDLDKEIEKVDQDRQFPIDDLDLKGNEGTEPNSKVRELFDLIVHLWKNVSESIVSSSLESSDLQNPYSRMLLESKNIIFRGAPGTGKSYLAKKVAADIISNGACENYKELNTEQKQQMEFVQFHPSYDYSDFVEGLRPKINDDGSMGFELQDGIFVQFVKHAQKNFDNTDDRQTPKKKYIFIIDEINRGEISKIFGELFFAIDPGYRGEGGEVSTQYANLHSDPAEKFSVPENVYIIGTMNDIDRSVDSFDFAMRRRFRFIEIKAKDRVDMLDELHDENLKNEAIRRMDNLNRQISEIDELNDNYHIGAAYFLRLKDLGSDFGKLWTDYLHPLLEDYIRGMNDEEQIMEKFKTAYDDVQISGSTDDGDTDNSSNENKS